MPAALDLVLVILVWQGQELRHPRFFLSGLYPEPCIVRYIYTHTTVYSCAAGRASVLAWTVNLGGKFMTFRLSVCR